MIFEVVTKFYNAKWELDKTTIRLFAVKFATGQTLAN